MTTEREVALQMILEEKDWSLTEFLDHYAFLHLEPDRYILQEWIEKDLLGIALEVLASEVTISLPESVVSLELIMLQVEGVPQGGVSVTWKAEDQADRTHALYIEPDGSTRDSFKITNPGWRDLPVAVVLSVTVAGKSCEIERSLMVKPKARKLRAIRTVLGDIRAGDPIVVTVTCDDKLPEDEAVTIYYKIHTELSAVAESQAQMEGGKCLFEVTALNLEEAGVRNYPYRMDIQIGGICGDTQLGPEFVPATIIPSVEEERLLLMERAALAIADQDFIALCFVMANLDELGFKGDSVWVLEEYRVAGLTCKLDHDYGAVWAAMKTWVSLATDSPLCPEVWQALDNVHDQQKRFLEAQILERAAALASAGRLLGVEPLTLEQLQQEQKELVAVIEAMPEMPPKLLIMAAMHTLMLATIEAVWGDQEAGSVEA